MSYLAVAFAQFIETRCWNSKKIFSFNTLRPRQNGRLFAGDIFKRIFVIENIRISIKISLKFVPKGLINNIPALVLIMAWRRPGDKPLSEPMMVRSLTYICVTRPQWVKIWFVVFCYLGNVDYEIQLPVLLKCKQCRPLMFPLASVWMRYWTNSQIASNLRPHALHVTSLWCVIPKSLTGHKLFGRSVFLTW